MAKTVETAMTLMLMAVSLLDKAGEADGARQLRAAIDTVRRGPGLTAADPPLPHIHRAKPAGLSRLTALFRRTHVT